MFTRNVRLILRDQTSDQIDSMAQLHPSGESDRSLVHGSRPRAMFHVPRRRQRPVVRLGAFFGQRLLVGERRLRG